MKKYLDFQDVLLLPNECSEIESRSKARVTDIQGNVPLSVANMETIGTFDVARIASAKYKWKTYISKHYSVREWRKFIQETPYETFKYVIPTFGVRDEDLKKAEQIWMDIPVQYGIVERTFCFDVANGHVIANMEKVANFLKRFPVENVIFGNVANPGVLDYLSNWMSFGLMTDSHKIEKVGVKVGIGSGSVCTTRLVTGIGAPQYTIVSEFRDKLVELRKKWPKEYPFFYIISDGGIRNSGDIVKAFVAGAHEVMMGGLLAGTYTTGDVFYGSSSEASRSYISRADHNFKNNLPPPTAEGIVTKIRRDITLDNHIESIEGGIKSALTYLGASDIGDLISEYEFFRRLVIQVNRQNDNYGVYNG